MLASLLLLGGLGCHGGEETGCEGAQALRLAVREGDYVHAVAEQGTRDVAVTLSGPGRRRLLTVDSLATSGAPWPAEEVHWVADSPGEIRLEVTLEGPRGPCPLSLAAHRPATPADRERTLAEADLARGHERRRTREKEPCRAGIAPYEQAQRRFAELGLPRRRGEALFGLGLLLKECLEENAAALQAFTRAAPLFAGGGQAEAKLRQHRGESRFALGDVDGAIGEYRQALELWRRTGSRADEALTSNTLGYALQMQGRYDEAAAHFDRALALWKEGDDAGQWASTLLNRGHLRRDLGETERARGRFEAALGLYRQAKDRAGEAVALNALGLVALDEGRPEAAMEPLRRALALREPGSRELAVTLTSLGVAYRQLGRLEEARAAYAEALPIYRRHGETREEARSLLNLGWLEVATGHDEAAHGHFDRALALFATLADPAHVAWALRGKAEVLRRRDELATARGLMEEALATVETHRSGQRSHDTRAAFFATQQDHYDFLIDLLMVMHRRSPAAGHDAEALGVAERALARSLLDGLAASGADLRRGADPDLLAHERELEEAIDGLVARQTRLTQDHDATEAQLRPVEEDLRRRWDELDRVRVELRASAPRYAALTQPRPWSAAEIQRALDPDTLLLEYRLGEPRSYLWAVTPDALASFELPGRAALEGVARQAAGLLARSRGRKAEISARMQLARLSATLLGPAAHLLPGKRLLVVGDGALQSLPFAALPAPGSGEPLVARHEVVGLPSVSVLGELRRQVTGRAPAPKTVWVLADPDFGGAFTPLPHTREEAAAILGLAPAAGRAAVLGREASRRAVLSGALRDHRFLHFATHGSFAAGEPGGGRLVLAQVDPRDRPVANGFLHLADIYELDLRADLVVLSACRSALGREVRGEGTMGMTRGFFYAGAERVLVSLWNVNDRVSAELMRRFYRGMLEEGLAPAAALRTAQNEIRSQERWEAPYYWAGFTLQGEWRGDGSPAIHPPASRRAR